MATPPTPPRPPLRPACRHPRSLPHHRRRAHLPPTTPKLITLGALRSFGDGLEVAAERGAWFDGDDPPVVLPDLLEDGGEQPVALGWRGLDLPKAPEVREQLVGFGEERVGRW